MKKVTRISPRQYAWTAATVLTIGCMLIIPPSLAVLAKKDVWLVHLLPMTLSLFVIGMLYTLSQLFPNKNLFEINVSLMRGGGHVVNLILIIHLWFILLRDINFIAHFIHISLLQRTPEEIIVATFALLLIYYGKKGIEDHVRVNELIYPVFFLFILLLPFLLFDEASLHRAEPLMTAQPWRMASAALISFGWFGDIMLIMGAFMHTVASPGKFRAALRHAVWLTTFSLTLLFFLITIVLGPGIAEKVLFPNVTLIRQIELTDFLDRLELFLLSIWVPLIMLKIIIIYKAALICIGSFTPQTDAKVYNRSFGLFVMFTSLISFRTVSELFAYGTYTTIAITIIVQLFLIVTYIIAKLKMKKEGRVKNKYEEQEDRMKKWNRRTNGLVFISLASLAIGFTFAKHVYWVGYIASIGVVTCIILGVICTWQEMKVAK